MKSLDLKNMSAYITVLLTSL